MARFAQKSRTTKETSVQVKLQLEGNRDIQINTQVPFFDHMLTLLAFHAGFDLTIQAMGDTLVDDHHTVEDVGIVFGQAFLEALGDKVGLNRYGVSYLPMDEVLSRCVIDISNRPYLSYKTTYKRNSIGGLSLENVQEFMKSFAMEARITLHLETLYGDNDHHKVESLFKALGRALKEAIRVDGTTISSTKGSLS